MKIALITDTHLGARNDNPYYADYFYKFFTELFFPYLKQHNIKTLIHLGDIVDRRKFINFKTSNLFRLNFMQRLWQEKIDTHIIIGNHDTYYKNTNEVNAVDELLTTYDGLHEPFIYTNPKVVELGGIRILFLPWVNSSNEEQTKMMLEQESADIVLGHLAVKGFMMNNGHMSDTGLEKSLFKRFEKVLTGHFHKKADDGQIYYLGSPYEFSWSDYNCPKGFHILDTETREIERIKNPLTIHHKINYNDELNDYSNYDYSQCKDKFVKLIVDKKKDYYLFDKFIDDMYKKTNVYDLKIIEDYSDLDASTVADDIAEKSEDTPTLLENYINQTETKLDKNRLKTLMKSLYTEAGDVDV